MSSAENLANIEKYRQIAQRLAHPDGLTDDEARRLAREGKAFVHIDGGLHSTEVAGAQHTLQLAYDLVAQADDRARSSRSSTTSSCCCGRRSIRTARTSCRSGTGERRHAVRDGAAAPSSTRSTSATTTIATPTC